MQPSTHAMPAIGSLQRASPAPAIVAGSMLLLNKVVMALFVGLGPIFIFSLLFEPTKQLFNRWLFYGIGTMFSLAVLSVMVAIALDMVLAVAGSRQSVPNLEYQPPGEPSDQRVAANRSSCGPYGMLNMSDINTMGVRTLLLLSLVFHGAVANAQNCAGMPAVNGVCIPPDSPTSPLNSTYGNQARHDPSVAYYWKTTWGAIASDSTSGDMGFSTAEFSQARARRTAVKRCKERGGEKCKVALAYHNQCAVVAWSSENGEPVGGAAVFQGAESIKIASEHAIPLCSSIRGGGECTVVYSNCTMPIYLRR